MAIKRKKRAKKKAKKKAHKKVGVNAVSRVSKKKPTTRLKKRRKANVKKGYYPNPTIKMYVAYVLNEGVKYYYHGYRAGKGLVFKDENVGALWYRSPKNAVDEVSYLIEKSSTKSVARNTGKVKAEIFGPK